jgi:hypothetical protein
MLRPAYAFSVRQSKARARLQLHPVQCCAAALRDAAAQSALAAEEDQTDACEDEMNSLFEFLTAEPATCLTA